MAKVIADRMTAQVEGDFVVFLIGMRINSFWKVHKWLPVAMAMPRMLRELQQDPKSGYLGAESWFGNPTILSFPTKLPFARSESWRTPVSALGLIVGSVMGPITSVKMGYERR
jgi:fumigallin biosynthesis monooxygenase-like protein